MMDQIIIVLFIIYFYILSDIVNNDVLVLTSLIGQMFVGVLENNSHHDMATTCLSVQYHDDDFNFTIV